MELWAPEFPSKREEFLVRLDRETARKLAITPIEKDASSHLNTLIAQMLSERHWTLAGQSAARFFSSDGTTTALLSSINLNVGGKWLAANERLSEVLQYSPHKDPLTYDSHNIDLPSEAQLLLRAFALYARYIPYLLEG